jgi:uncharacterized protein
MTIQLAPGVRGFEHPSGVSVVRGAVSNRLLAVGMARRGPVGRPVPVRSYEQFVDEFGEDFDYGELAIQMRQFFNAGGSDAVVVRAANNSAPANVTLNTEFGPPALQIVAEDDGILGRQIRAIVDYGTPDPELTFNLTVYREVTDRQGRPRRESQEIYRNLSMDPFHPNYVQSAVNGRSDLIRVDAENFAAPVDLTVAHEAEVFSQSGHVNLTLATLRGRIDGLVGDLVVELNGHHIVPVSLNIPAAPADSLVDLQNAINQAISGQSLGATVRVTAEPVGVGGHVSLRIAVDNAVGTRSIRILPAQQADVTAQLGLGRLRGGIEVGVYSALRPAMTGISTRAFAAAGDLTPIFAQIAVAAGSPVDFDDGTAGTAVAGVNWGIAGAANPFDDNDPATPLSFAAFEEHLDTLEAALNAAPLAPPPTTLGGRWTFRRIGARIQGLRNDGALAASTNATFTTAGANPYLDAAVAVRASYALGQDGGAGGSDGTAPLRADLRQIFTRVSREVRIFNILILPRGDAQTDVMRSALWGMASIYCQQENALLLVDPLSDNRAWSTVDEVTAAAGLATFKSGIVPEVSAVFWPRIRTRIGTASPAVDPSGTIAGVMAKSIAKTGPWDAAAGLSAPLIGASGLEYQMSDAENGVINPRGINALRMKSTGLVCWGARTLAGDDDYSNRDFAYIPVRITTDFIENSMLAALEGFVFKKNNSTTWANIEMMGKAFMSGLHKKGAFSAVAADDAYEVRCNELTTSQAEILQGILNVWVKFAPNFPAEFIHLHIQHKFEQPAI